MSTPVWLGSDVQSVTLPKGHLNIIYCRRMKRSRQAKKADAKLRSETFWATNLTEKGKSWKIIQLQQEHLKSNDNYVLPEQQKVKVQKWSSKLVIVKVVGISLVISFNCSPSWSYFSIYKLSLVCYETFLMFIGLSLAAEEFGSLWKMNITSESSRKLSLYYTH